MTSNPDSVRSYCIGNVQGAIALLSAYHHLPLADRALLATSIYQRLGRLEEALSISDSPARLGQDLHRSYRQYARDVRNYLIRA